ncbi:hypothetical protein NECAME_01846 [Necator americanus]|uniref:Uncharacterized protein n=1 Tax=Necator americanus TaxID=51031 RepID=W2TPV6_NECAM|nr:hypothetical protein NECAME_01846 [Necator americanus]ETN83047.1 hypothetical protein NECAME_01846 [Necator americanus]
MSQKDHYSQSICIIIYVRHKIPASKPVTDSADFPLFDIWAEAACCGRPVWVIESYGDPLLIQDSNRGILGRCVRMEGEGGSCWQCLVEGVDREVARLERGHLRFAADVSFQLKLLILAAMTRVVGQPRPYLEL